MLRSRETARFRRQLRNSASRIQEFREMTRLLAAVLFLAAATPAFACDWQRSVATDNSSTVASQPSNGQSAPAGTTTDQTPS